MKKTVKFLITLSLISCLVASGFTALAEEKKGDEKKDEAPEKEKKLTVEEIVGKANHVSYYQGHDGKSYVEMVITDSQGRTRKRGFTILRRNQDKKDHEQKYYVYFDKPSDVRKLVFLVWKHIGKDDDRWLYLPALNLVKRIAASDKRTSFVGSHFYYEDVSGRSLEEDEHSLEATNEKFYIVKNTPKKPDEVEFSSYRVWIDKENFMPMKAEYMDKNGKKYRVMEAIQVETIDDFPTVTKSRITDLESGGNTVMTFTEVKYDIGLPENVFTERFLRRAPRRWLNK